MAWLGWKLTNKNHITLQQYRESGKLVLMCAHKCDHKWSTSTFIVTQLFVYCLE